MLANARSFTTEVAVGSAEADLAFPEHSMWRPGGHMGVGNPGGATGIRVRTAV